MMHELINEISFIASVPRSTTLLLTNDLLVTGEFSHAARCLFH